MGHQKSMIKRRDDINMQFAEITQLISNARNKVLRLANTALIDLYWNVGHCISDRISSAEWGDGVVTQLAEYISKTAPDLKGFSDKNLWRMKQFYETIVFHNVSHYHLLILYLQKFKQSQKIHGKEWRITL